MFVVGEVMLTQVCLLKCRAADQDLTLMSIVHLVLIFLGAANAGSISVSDVRECLLLIKDAYLSS